MTEPHMTFFETPRKPIPGHMLFEALQPPSEIVLAVNPRTSFEEIVGILQAAKDTENIVILELALSEMNMQGGYTGLTPYTSAERIRKAAEKVGWYGYVLHADHVQIGRKTRTVDRDELENVKKELEARINAGFTSFAIDASHLFDRNAKKVEDQLRNIADVSVEMFKYIESKVGDLPFWKGGRSWGDRYNRVYDG